jgi:hypothetical protein
MLTAAFAGSPVQALLAEILRNSQSLAEPAVADEVTILVWKFD